MRKNIIISIGMSILLTFAVTSTSFALDYQAESKTIGIDTALVMDIDNGMIIAPLATNSLCAWTCYEEETGKECLKRSFYVSTYKDGSIWKFYTPTNNGSTLKSGFTNNSSSATRSSTLRGIDGWSKCRSTARKVDITGTAHWAISNSGTPYMAGHSNLR